MTALVVIVVIVMIWAWWTHRLSGWSLLAGLVVGLLLGQTTVGPPLTDGVHAVGAAVADASSAALHSVRK